MELNLHVKVCNEDFMNIPVKTSYTIQEIKTQIESLKDIPAKDQILTLNKVDLENDVKLTKDQIENSVIWLSYQSKEIFLHIFENWRTKKETFKLEIDWEESISAIKTKISWKKKIPSAWMQIYLGNGVWNNEAKLKPNDDLTDNDIFKKALKYGMSVMISGYIKINDIDFDSKLLIEVEAFETVTEVKKKVKEIWTTNSSNFPLQDPRISKRSKFFETNTADPVLYITDEFGMLKILDDSDQQLFEYGLQKLLDEKFVLTRNPESYSNDTYPIYVSIFDNSLIQERQKLEFSHNATIGFVKSNILECNILNGFKNFQPDQFQLTTYGQMYTTYFKIIFKDEERTLKEFGIGKGHHLKLERIRIETNAIENINADKIVHDDDDQDYILESETNSSSDDSDYSEVDEKCPECGKIDGDSSQMMYCIKCNDWYHWSCAGIKRRLRKESNSYCKNCKHLVELPVSQSVDLSATTENGKNSKTVVPREEHDEDSDGGEGGNARIPEDASEEVVAIGGGGDSSSEDNGSDGDSLDNSERNENSDIGGGDSDDNGEGDGNSDDRRYNSGSEDDDANSDDNRRDRNGESVENGGGNRGKSDLGSNSNSDDDSIEDELLQNFEDQISKVHLTF